LFRSPRSRLAFGAGLLALGLPAWSAAAVAPRLVVSGSTEVADEILDVRVDLKNEGDGPTGTLTVEGELLGRTQSAKLETGVAPGATQSVRLHYPMQVPRPGVHALTLLLEYPATGGTNMVSQRAFLLLALGANPPPAVKLTLPDTTLDSGARPRLGLESSDGQPHRVKLRVYTPRGLRGLAPLEPVEVPATGRVEAPLELYRGAAPRDTQQGILVVASSEDGELERTSVSTAVVRLQPDPALLPRLRPWLVGLLALLLSAAVAIEVQAIRRGVPVEGAAEGAVPDQNE